MARSFLILLVMAILADARCFAQDSTRAAPSPAGTRTVVPLDSGLVFHREAGDDPLAFRFQQNTARPLAAYLSTSADRFFGFERYELSRVDCMWHGAGGGMRLGMIAGAAGMASGLFDEDAAWYLVGAAAALGAIFGSMKADDPNFTVRIRWLPPDDERR